VAWARGLLAQYNVNVLPGSLLARSAQGPDPTCPPVNPGAGRVRMALVAPLDECLEAAQRIVAYCENPRMSTHPLQAVIDLAWESRAEISAINAPEVRDAVERVIADLNAGRLRVAERRGVGDWQVNQWVKKAVLLSFRLNDNKRHARRRPGVLRQGQDQVQQPGRRADARQRRARGAAGRGAARQLHRQGRGADAQLREHRRLCGRNTMVDTWATVGSCAQIGKNVHLSGGVGIGGVLEPLQANPTIIEDNCFIGARSEVVEGVIVEENSVISMGVYIGQSTKIYDRATGTVSYGRIPAGSVVVSGQPAQRRRPVQPVLRGDREEGRRADPRQDQHQRTAARQYHPRSGFAAPPQGGAPSGPRAGSAAAAWCANR
jgi:2,3,4,5-tetrahydropyridine-2-carboxylate N-succinyltransferase